MELYPEELLYLVLDLYNSLDDESICQNARTRKGLEMGSLCNSRFNAGCAFDLPHFQWATSDDVCGGLVDVLHHPRIGLRPPTVDAAAADDSSNSD